MFLNQLMIPIQLLTSKQSISGIHSYSTIQFQCEMLQVFRVGEVVPQDPTAIQNAINSLNNKTKTRKSDLTDVSKPLRAEKERKDALANIDINNYASQYQLLCFTFATCSGFSNCTFH